MGMLVSLLCICSVCIFSSVGEIVVLMYAHWSTRLRGQVPVIEHISLPGQTAAEIEAQVNLETKTVEELKTLDIFEYRALAISVLCSLLLIPVFVLICIFASCRTFVCIA
jgi:hypothetical protein